MRHVKIELGCDWPDCDMRESEGGEEIKTTTLAVNSRAPREFHLCFKHRTALDEVIQPLLKSGTAVTLAKSSRTAAANSAAAELTGTATATKAKVKCLECDKSYLPGAGMGQHVVRSHGYATLAEYNERNAVETTASTKKRARGTG
jgi:hypothetical protein